MGATQEQEGRGRAMSVAVALVQDPPPVVPAVRGRPKLRGVSHQIAAFAAGPAALVLAARAPTRTALTGALVYGLSMVVLFTVSAVYHRVYWPLSIRRVIGRVDHSAIFLLIAGTYTPFCLLLGLVWAGAFIGIAIVIGWVGIPKPLRASLYVVLGWFVFPVVPLLRAALGDAAIGLLFVGGAFYTVGAVIYGLRRPDPFPRIFGFHEIFHLLVIAAAICHYLVVDAAVRATF
jgi:hemolysin III